MNVAIRVDASEKIGVGHLARCKNLAHRLAENGCNVIFISRDLGGPFLEGVRQSQYELIVLPAPSAMDSCEAERNPGSHGSWLETSWELDACQTVTALKEHPDLDWLVVDHYGIDGRWHREVKRSAPQIFVIDDLADRTFECDLLLNQSHWGSGTGLYQNLVPSTCVVLIGPEHTILASHAHKTRDINRNDKVSRILVSFGGADYNNLSAEAMEVLHVVLPPTVKVDLVVGGGNPHITELHAYGRRPNTTVHTNVEDLTPLIINADLGVGAGGLTSIERAYLGLPSLVKVASYNQIHTLYEMNRRGTVRLYKQPPELEHLVREVLSSGPFIVPEVVQDGSDHIVKIMLRRTDRTHGNRDVATTCL